MGPDERASREGDAGAGAPFTPGPSPQQREPQDAALARSHPEIFVGAAFVGGLVAARVLKLVRR